MVWDTSNLKSQILFDFSTVVKFASVSQMQLSRIRECYIFWLEEKKTEEISKC